MINLSSTEEAIADYNRVVCKEPPHLVIQRLVERLAAAEQHDSEQRARRSHARQKAEAERAQVARRAEEDKAKLRREVDMKLRDVIETVCEVGEGYVVPATEFNSVTRCHGMGRGMKGAMARQGYIFKQCRLDGRTTDVYLGLKMRA